MLFKRRELTGTGGDAADFSTTEHWIDLTMVIICILSAGLAAGLTIGLVSIDRNELRLLSINGTDAQKKQAQKILPLIKDHHWLLVTLFLFNATANEALPVFLTGLVPEYAAIVIAAFSVLVFGEIIPSSIFSGPNQLEIAAYLAPVVKVLLFLFYVIARPIGLLLDAWLGKHDEHGKAPFNAKDLYTLLNLSRADVVNRQHSNHQNSEGLSRAPSILHGDLATPFLDDDAVLIAQGALISSKKTVKSLTKPGYFSVDGDEVIDLDWLEKIGNTGYSRVCVTQKTRNNVNFVGYFVVKEILCNMKKYLAPILSKKSSIESPPGSPTFQVSHVKDLPIYPIYYFKEGDSILVALNQFQNGLSRIAAVTTDGYPTSPVLGYFSMEDVVEAIIQEEIQDEKDSRQNSKQIFNALSNPIFSDDKSYNSDQNQNQNGNTEATQTRSMNGISLTEVSWMQSFLPDTQNSQSKV